MIDETRIVFRRSVEHASEAVALLRMSRQIHDAKRKGLIDEATANDAVARLNTEAVAEIEESLRLQKLVFTERRTNKPN